MAIFGFTAAEKTNPIKPNQTRAGITPNALKRLVVTL